MAVAIIHWKNYYFFLGAKVGLGTLPFDKPLMENQHIIFAGKRWIVTNINSKKKLIVVKKTIGGSAPIFGGDGQIVHDQIRRAMKQAYLEGNCPIYLNDISKSLFSEGVEYFYNAQLDKKSVVQDGNTVYIFSWRGDRIVNTITVLLRSRELHVDCFGGVMAVSNCSINSFKYAVGSFLEREKPTAVELAHNLPDTMIDRPRCFASKTD